VEEQAEQDLQIQSQVQQRITLEAAVDLDQLVAPLVDHLLVEQVQTHLMVEQVLQIQDLEEAEDQLGDLSDKVVMEDLE
jgi:hypothetical protein